jgi:5-methylcytosine-specific restriction endonuclease McrA
MTRTVVDISGTKIGKLTVRKFLYSENGDTHWECICDCGNVCVKKKKHLLYGKATKSCGCLYKEVKRAKPQKGVKSLTERYSQYKYAATIRRQGDGITFDISFSEFKSIVTGACHYCGSVAFSSDDRHYINGIDRVDSNKGYTLDNVVSCCKHCNWAKRAFSVEEFNEWLDAVALHRIRQKPQLKSTLDEELAAEAIRVC